MASYLFVHVKPEHRPDRDFLFLPNGNSRKDYYPDAVKFLREDGFEEKDIPKRATFYEIFRAVFPNVSRARADPFARCNDCVTIYQILRRPSSYTPECVRKFSMLSLSVHYSLFKIIMMSCVNNNPNVMCHHYLFSGLAEECRCRHSREIRLARFKYDSRKVRFILYLPVLLLW